MFTIRVVRASIALGLLAGPALAFSQQTHEIKITPYVGMFVPATKLARINTTVDGTSCRPRDRESWREGVPD